VSGSGGAETPAPPGGYFPVVYDELKRLAAARLAGERAGHSLDATALVHEAYLRLGAASFADRSGFFRAAAVPIQRILVDRLGAASFADRSGFFRAAAVPIQRILVDRARCGKAARRGGGARTLVLVGDAPALGADPDLVLDVELELGRRLAQENATAAEVARLRLFAGLSVDEAALAMGVSRATAFREWAYARSRLATALESAR
jgi:DNA-directed RNA polymerase specialized sigma24 family protein